MILVEHYPIPDAIEHATLDAKYLLSCLSAPEVLGGPGAGRGATRTWGGSRTYGGHCIKKPAKISRENDRKIDDFWRISQ